MGGGHVSRPDFGMPQPDPAHTLTRVADSGAVDVSPGLWHDVVALLPSLRTSPS